MFKSLKILLTTLASSGLVLLTLCLGSQNLNDRHSINLGTTKTAPLPSGFIVGLSLTIGIFTGGSLSALFSQEKNNNK